LRFAEWVAGRGARAPRAAGTRSAR
jgi:hypothetical protein